jgi:hypothetical protein
MKQDQGLDSDDARLLRLRDTALTALGGRATGGEIVFAGGHP